jgi:hypothetical protein
MGTARLTLQTLLSFAPPGFNAIWIRPRPAGPVRNSKNGRYWQRRRFPKRNGETDAEQTHRKFLTGLAIARKTRVVTV